MGFKLRKAGVCARPGNGWRDKVTNVAAAAAAAPRRRRRHHHRGTEDFCFAQNLLVFHQHGLWLDSSTEGGQLVQYYVSVVQGPVWPEHFNPMGGRAKTVATGGNGRTDRQRIFCCC